MNGQLPLQPISSEISESCETTEHEKLLDLELSMTRISTTATPEHVSYQQILSLITQKSSMLNLAELTASVSMRFVSSAVCTICCVHFVYTLLHAKCKARGGNAQPERHCFLVDPKLNCIERI